MNSGQHSDDDLRPADDLDAATGQDPTGDPRDPDGQEPKSSRAFWGAGLAGIAAGVLAFIVTTGAGERPAEAVTPSAPLASATALTPSAGGAPQARIVEPLPEGDDLAPDGSDSAEAPPVKERPDAALLVGMLKKAHEAMHADEDKAAMKVSLDAAYADVFGKQKLWLSTAKAFHNTHGLGRFFRNGRGTPLATALVKLVIELPAHGLNPGDYDVDRLVKLAGGEAAVAGDVRPAPVGDAVRGFVTGILDAPEFDETEVLSSLDEAPASLSATTLGTAVQQISTQKGQGALPSDAAGDTAFVRALIKLSLDFRFLRMSGPQIIHTADTALDRQSKNIKQLLAQVVGAESATEGIKMLLPRHPQYDAMRGILARYRALVEAGGCEQIPKSWRFRVGSKGKEVKKLQARLRCEGYFDGEDDGILEGATADGLKRYQEEHDLEAEGTVGDEAVKSMNVPLERRVSQIELTLQRMRESLDDRMTNYFIRVNLPSFMLTVYEDYKPIRRQRVIVGTNRLDDDKVKLIQGHINRTKLFGSRLYQVIVNPTWILPKRVEEGELKTSISKDPDYLDKQNIRRVTLSSGTEVLIQGAGDGNVLGKVKFLLEETNAIYLHDTDKRYLFKKTRRDFSHGCMRLDDAVDFAKWILARGGYDEAEVERAFGSSVSQRGFDLKEPISLVTEYMTVDLLEDGRPVFYADIYGYDDAALNGRLPVRETQRWGSVLLRPRWVPLVESSIVNEWRAAGKSAPRDYKPDAAPKKPDAAPKKPDAAPK